MKIEDIYNKYVDNLQPDKQFINSLKPELQKSFDKRNNEKQNLCMIKITETVEYKKFSLWNYVSIMTLMLVFLAFSMTAASLFNNNTDDKQVFETTYTEASTQEIYVYDTTAETSENKIILTETATELSSKTTEESEYTENIETSEYQETYPNPDNNYYYNNESIYTEQEYIQTETTVSETTEITLHSEEYTSDTETYLSESETSESTEYTEEENILNFESAAASSGEDTHIYLRIKTSEYNITIMRAVIDFDSDYLELKNINAYSEPKGDTECELYINDNTFLLQIINTGEDNILTLDFEFSVSENAPVGKYEISLSGEMVDNPHNNLIYIDEKSFIIIE